MLFSIKDKLKRIFSTLNSHFNFALLFALFSSKMFSKINFFSENNPSEEQETLLESLSSAAVETASLMLTQEMGTAYIDLFQYAEGFFKKHRVLSKDTPAANNSNESDKSVSSSHTYNLRTAAQRTVPQRLKY